MAALRGCHKASNSRRNFATFSLSEEIGSGHIGWRQRVTVTLVGVNCPAVITDISKNMERQGFRTLEQHDTMGRQTPECRSLLEPLPKPSRHVAVGADITLPSVLDHRRTSERTTGSVWSCSHQSWCATVHSTESFNPQENGTAGFHPSLLSLAPLSP